MLINSFIQKLSNYQISFFTGVPDSQLKALCDYLNAVSPKSNITAANEGNAVAIAAGYHMATGKTPCVYLQNSGLGNIINPYTSLLNDNVYAIPTLFVVGWRGEPGVHDEPQHVFQGAVTLSLLDTLDISYVVLSKETTVDELEVALLKFSQGFKDGKSCAIVVRKGALTIDEDAVYKNDNLLKREDVIRCITEFSGEGVIVSTTGKTSRELFEIREAGKQSHKYDFLTVGSMGHSSSIALGIALSKPDANVWCIDGDGALLMHMGAMALVGAEAPANFIHVVINNAAHESVGGMPTVAGSIDLVSIAKACGYAFACSVRGMDELRDVLLKIEDSPKPAFIEVAAAIGSRADLGRPTKTPIENKDAFMDYLKEL